MHIRHAAMTAAIVITATGCAKAPESIQASYVSPLRYQGLSCRQLAVEASNLDGALATASAQQRQARTNDTVGVILIGLPVSSFSGGNVAADVARLKGEREAVRQTALAKGCGGAGVPAGGVIGAS